MTPFWQQKTSNNQARLCEVCGKKPKFVEGNVEHPYCGRACARHAGNAPIACKFPNCKYTGKPALSGYCSQAHARDAPRNEVQNTQASSPILRELDVNGPTFKELESTFSSRWRSSTILPTIKKVYEVTDTASNRKKYDDFKAKLAATDPVEEIKTFYSHQCICDLGTKGPTLCEFKSCGICMVVKSSFRRFVFDRKADHGRLGDGIYTHLDASQADKAATSCTTSPYRVMTMCRIAKPSNPSVLGDFDPVFCHMADEILPEYIVMYVKP